MSEKYYMVATYDAGSGHGDELFLLKINNGRLLAYSVEFDSCTFDIEDACNPENYKQASWISLGQYEWAPANLNDIRAVGLDKHLIGSKINMKISTPMDPI